MSESAPLHSRRSTFGSGVTRDAKLKDQATGDPCDARIVRIGLATCEIGDETAPEPDLPEPGAPVMVSRTVRLPFEMNERIKAEAAAREVNYSDVLRDWLAIGAAATAVQTQGDDMVSRAEVQRVMALALALASVHPLQKRPA